jgi:hypothetical protein
MVKINNSNKKEWLLYFYLFKLNIKIIKVKINKIIYYEISVFFRLFFYF